MNVCAMFFMLAASLTVMVVPVSAEAKVTRDEYGIPSIHADTEQELFEAYGYVTAVDRLWQTEVNKRYGRDIWTEVSGIRSAGKTDGLHSRRIPEDH